MKDKYNLDNLNDIAKQYGCILTRDTVNCNRNSGAQSGNELWLGEFDDKEIEAAAFFHELGHYISTRELKPEYWLCRMSCECLAWEYGFKLAREHGFNFDYDGHKVRKYARECLLSYNKPDNFK